jgi:rhodanese-related sulfurtransferase
MNFVNSKYAITLWRRFITKSAILLAVSSAIIVDASGQGFADEANDWGVEARAQTKSWPYTANTPLLLPGAKTIYTSDLAKLLSEGVPPVLVDVLGEDKMIAGAISLAGIGSASLAQPLRDRFKKTLEQLTEGNLQKPIVFYCHHSRCWWSYNAALHAKQLGYTQLYWYRGGYDAWVASGGKTVPTQKPQGW